MDSFSQQLHDIALGHAAIAKAGIEAGQREAIPYKRALQAIVYAYDENEVIPTKLLAAIVAAKGLL